MAALFDGDDPPLDHSQFNELSTMPDQRYWLLRALGLLLEEAARDAPLCICLDDLHWADEGTIAAVRALARRLEAAPVLWVGVRCHPDRAEERELGRPDRIRFSIPAQPATTRLLPRTAAPRRSRTRH